MAEGHVFTYQTRLVANHEVQAALGAYAELYGRAERTLFAQRQKPDFEGNAAKRQFLQRFGLSARQYNAIRTGLDGKIASIKERRPELIEESERRIAKANKTIARLQTKLQDLLDPATTLKSGRVVLTLTATQRRKYVDSLVANLHQKRRRLATLQDRLLPVKADELAGTVRLCFGSKKLFRAQFDLAANGYQALDAWRKDWHKARAAQFFVLGSKDETAGNQGCQALPGADGSFTFRLRLPDGLAEYGKYVEIPGVRFAYGHEQIMGALASSSRITAKNDQGKNVTKRTGTAISYRYLNDDKGWRVFVSLTVQPVDTATHAFLGAIGVDINSDHLAVSQTDRFGNWVDSIRFDLCAYGASNEQRRASIGDAVKQIAVLAAVAGKPVAIEKLDFRGKRATLEGTHPKQARMLSSLAYNQTIRSIKAACFRAGVDVIEVNPAYTSTIGAINHAQRLGISVHQGAALAIARRGLGLSEKPILATKNSPNQIQPKPSTHTASVANLQWMVTAPTGEGGHVTLPLSVRNRGRHVWSQWASVRKALAAALAAQRRSGTPKGTPAPLSPARQTSCAHRHSTAKPRGANRSKHCSVSVDNNLPDLPF